MAALVRRLTRNERWTVWLAVTPDSFARAPFRGLPKGVRRIPQGRVACDIGETEMAAYIRGRFDKLGVPSYSSPEDTARAMAALVHYGLYLKKNGYYEDYIEQFKQKVRT